MREPATGQIFAGKYRLELLIGHGGMGSVWLARHSSLDMPVAIKFMGAHAQADLESRQRFDREARALAALRTPNIVQVLDHGVDDDTPYIVMEYLEGEDLSTRLQRKRRLALDETSRIVMQVAKGLRRAHEAGITHRDLKPSNIFLARIDDEEVAKVLDFGVAKLALAGVLAESQLTKTGTLLGSPGYMSPEQARGKEVDFRSDLWAFAVIVFRAVTGIKPFSGDSIAELVIKLCIDPRPIASKLAPDLPPNIDRFFEKAFAASPEERFGSAVEMASAFAQTIGQPGIEVSRAGPSPVAGVAPAALEAPAIPASFAAYANAPAGATLVLPPSSAFAPPASGAVLPAIHAPPAPLPALLARPAQTLRSAIVVPVAPPFTPLREPTPTPASFTGFAPSGADTASAPPAAGPAAAPIPESALKHRPVGADAFSSAEDRALNESVALSEAAQNAPPTATLPPSSGRDPNTPIGMRLHPPGPPHLPAKAAPPHAAPVKVDIKLVLFAAAGAAVLAVFFALAISGLRRRHTNALAPHPEGDVAPMMVIPTATELPTAPALTTAPETASSATAEPASTDTSSTTTELTTSDPGASSATAEPTAAPTSEPVTAPSIEPTSAATVEPAPSATHTVTKPKPTSTTSPQPKSSGKTPAPPGSSKKKNPKPNFGY